MLTAEFAGSGTTPVVMKVIVGRFVAPEDTNWVVAQSLFVLSYVVPTVEVVGERTM